MTDAEYGRALYEADQALYAEDRSWDNVNSSTKKNFTQIALNFLKKIGSPKEESNNAWRPY